MIPLIQHEVINRRGWIEEHTFLDMLTLAQTAPGPISLNTAVFVGYKCRGVLGALIAVLGVVLPSFFIILLIAIFFSEIRTNHWVDAAFKGMRPAVVALIVAPIIGLCRGMNRWLIVVAVAVACELRAASHRVWSIFICRKEFVGVGGYAHAANN